MVIDIHAHIWAGRYEIDKKEIIKACQLYDISKVYVSGLKGYYPKEDDVDEVNYEVNRFMNENPEYIGGFCYINPNNRNNMEVLVRGIEEYEMSGIKLWVATFCDDPKVFPLVEKCIDYGVPVLLHSFKKSVGQLKHETTGIEVANLARRYPEAIIIMAHLDGNCYHGMKAIRKHKNVYVDFCGSIYRRDDLDYAIEQIGASRILFGTDMPGSYLVSLGQVEEADITDEDKEKILYKNALKILNINR